MMEIDWDKIMEKVPELGSVLAVIFFALKLAEIHRDNIKILIETNQKNSAATMLEWREFLKGQNEITLRFMGDQTDQLRALSSEIAGLSALLLEHNTRDAERRRTAR